MLPRKVADDDSSEKESHANELSRVLEAVNALTSKVQSLQLDLDSQRRISQVPDDNLIQRKFWKDPLTLHFSINPKKIYLSFDGKNFPMWKDTVLNTISYVYKVHNPIIPNFFKTITNNAESSFLLILRQTIDDSTQQLLSDYNTTTSLFAALQR
ncbi:hypothetical protein O181_015698 [Austropuccinia psidii MF-1]|uniref:Uncharacterized protein n=1 Tax=Austropuccinia psidii MF-1 TaxID=1389203 RepID=A0A9Q3C2Y3_9BASI|nr:hypothetical protein [Austropuccinia psidii MF-1]